MALKTFKPYTKSTRGTILVDRSHLWKGKSEKTLTKKNDTERFGEITKVGLLQDIEVLDTKKNIELLILREINLKWLLK